MVTLKSSGYAPVNGLKMYYEIHGESGASDLPSGSVPLVLIHGGGSTIETSFANLIPLLAPHSQLIAVELQAHGRTSDRAAPESYQQDASDVVALLKHLKVEKANILGFSDGGCTTMQIAMSYPEILNKIVVVSSNYTRAGMMEGFFDFMETATIESMPELLKTGYMRVNPDPKGLQAMFEKDRARRIAFKDWTDNDLRSIKAPALLMVADKDVITVPHVVAMSQLIPDARLAVIPGTHGSFIGEEISYTKGSKMPEATATMVLEFLGLN
ncbi:alpha/beta hydrolase [Dyadobacter luticola]|uniref:Alpha/beta hydrolase n=2 Tax=Dyadobacter luticola TaxID=1979387 RepID=A0A5R9L6R8_9BACT|nr:alpha/beta hydrolase [Dyadobacter luticola]